MTNPRISFVMPVYNNARYLRQTLASMRWQTFTDWEAVCVNDGSTDESLAILQQFAAADSRFQIVDQENQGIVDALNAGIHAARGEWIARLDSDDVAVPERLAVQWQFVRKNPDVVVVGSDMMYTDPDGFPLRIERSYTEHADIEQALVDGTSHCFGHPSVLIHRDTLLEAGLYSKEYEWVEDLELWSRLVRLGRVANIPRVLVHYRQHEQSVCWNRRALQHERRHRLLAKVRAERGLASPTQPLKPPRKQSSAAGKWARRAARSGYYQTAFRQWRRQVAAQPFSLLTFRVTVEVVFRGAIALFTGRDARPASLPDWRNWNVAHADDSDSASRAA
ncbi:MAG: glycosyltransferase [Pirellulales bacterium]|nr:glycosyltransferase [Pirellulales bacterium]